MEQGDSLDRAAKALYGAMQSDGSNTGEARYSEQAVTGQDVEDRVRSYLQSQSPTGDLRWLEGQRAEDILIMLQWAEDLVDCDQDKIKDAVKDILSEHSTSKKKERTAQSREEKRQLAAKQLKEHEAIANVLVAYHSKNCTHKSTTPPNLTNIPGDIVGRLVELLTDVAQQPAHDGFDPEILNPIYEKFIALLNYLKVIEKLPAYRKLAGCGALMAMLAPATAQCNVETANNALAIVRQLKRI